MRIVCTKGCYLYGKKSRQENQKTEIRNWKGKECEKKMKKKTRKRDLIVDIG